MRDFIFYKIIIYLISVHPEQFEKTGYRASRTIFFSCWFSKIFIWIDLIKIDLFLVEYIKPKLKIIFWINLNKCRLKDHMWMIVLTKNLQPPVKQSEIWLTVIFALPPDFAFSILLFSRQHHFRHRKIFPLKPDDSVQNVCEQSF